MSQAGKYPSRLKAPTAILKYGFNWNPWLDGATITASVWTLTAPAGTLTKATEANVAGETSLFLSLGDLGDSVDVVNHITTNTGEEEERTMTINIVQR